jgi:hypothetical protein
MATTDLMVGIGAEYKGKAAFNKANKDILGLTKAVKSLAAGYVGLAGAQKAFRLGQQSLKAFVEDDAAAAQLTKTLSNLGLAFNSVDVENFINKTQQATGVLDDFLRPAFQSLLIATRDYAQAQKLLNLSLDISAGTGKDVAAVSAALSKAYLGNYTSLTRLGGGISKATVASGDLDQIIASLSANFRGDAAAAVQTYKGQLDLLKVSTENAKETIGEGLVIALSNLSDNNITNLSDAMNDFSTSIAEVIVGISVMIEKIKSIPGANLLKGLFSLQSIPVVGSYLEFFRKAGKAEIKSVRNSKKIVENTKATSKATTTIVSNTKKLTAEQTKQLALKKAQNVLEASSKIFDMDLIQNTAALQGKVTEDETLRLKLQREILLGNADAAAKLAQELLSVQIAAIIAGNVDPFGQLSDSVLEALRSVRQLRTELELLGSPKIKTPAQILAQDYQDVLIDMADPSFDLAMQETRAFLDSLKTTPTGNMDLNYQDAFARPNADRGFTPTELRIFIDPSAAQYGIGVASVNNSANGNSNNYSTIQSFAGGL